MAYAKQRRLDWSAQSLKTTNDELWTTNMPLYIQSETNPATRAILEKEYRMHAEAGKTVSKDATKEEAKDSKSDAAEVQDFSVPIKEKEEKKDTKNVRVEKKEEKKEEAKNATAEDSKEEAKEEKKPEKKEEKKVETKLVTKKD